MADVRWIKIVTDIFDDEKILLIESLPEADSIIVIWFKLLCLAGKQNNSGIFMLNDKIAYTEEMLSTVFRRPINTVRLAIETFEQFGMIETTDGVITVPNWDKYQNVESMDKIREQTRQRVATYREKQKRLSSNVTVTLRNATDIDKEEDKEKNIDISIPEKITKRFVKPTVEEVENYIRERNYSFDAETFVAHYESNGWRVGNTPMKSWKACCTTWEKRRRENATAKPSTNKFHNFDERKDNLDADVLSNFYKKMNPPED